MEPDEYTWRELHWMNDEREKAAWNHTASICYTIRAAMGDKNANWEQFHPHYQTQHNANERKRFQQLSKRNKT